MAAITTALLAGISPAGAEDLDCGDPGTSPNMSVGPDDPNGLDRDHDGVGCEDPSAPSPGAGTAGDSAAESVAEGPGAGEGASLPRTGSTTVPLAFAGVGLVAAGGAAFFARRFIYVPKHAR